jgi:hypothetical protein
VHEFKQRHTEVTAAETGATRATARLPGLDIEIVHRRTADGDAEEISINLRAAPSFEAFGRVLEAANPFAFWAQGAQVAWLQWLEAARALALPWTLALPRPSGNGASHSAQERRPAR